MLQGADEGVALSFCSCPWACPSRGCAPARSGAPHISRGAPSTPTG